MNDPCEKCKCNKSETFRKMCQGTPFEPGFCKSAHLHWQYIGEKICHEYAREKSMTRYHNEARKGHKPRKGW